MIYFLFLTFLLNADLFINDVKSISDEINKKPIVPKYINFKSGITKYKIKLEEKMKKEKVIKLKDNYDFDSLSPNKYTLNFKKSENFEFGTNFLILQLFLILIIV